MSFQPKGAAPVSKELVQEVEEHNIGLKTQYDEYCKSISEEEIENIEELVITLENMVNRVTGGLIVSALVIASSLIINSKAGPTYNGLSIMGIIGYLVSAFMALVLLFEMYRSTRKKNKKK